MLIAPGVGMGEGGKRAFARKILYSVTEFSVLFQKALKVLFVPPPLGG